MNATVVVSEIRFAPAKAELRARGLRGWITCLIDAHHRIDGIALRRTAAGEYVISFPARTDSLGKEHAYYLPADSVRAEITAQILDALRRGGWIA